MGRTGSLIRAKLGDSRPPPGNFCTVQRPKAWPFKPRLSAPNALVSTAPAHGIRIADDVAGYGTAGKRAFHTDGATSHAWRWHAVGSTRSHCRCPSCLRHSVASAPITRLCSTTCLKHHPSYTALLAVTTQTSTLPVVHSTASSYNPNQPSVLCCCVVSRRALRGGPPISTPRTHRQRCCTAVMPCHAAILPTCGVPCGPDRSWPHAAGRMHQTLSHCRSYKLF